MSDLRDQILHEIQEREPHISLSGTDWCAMAFLLASAVLGPDPEAIAEELEMDPIMAGTFAERARRNGIWAEAGVHYGPWEDPEEGGVRFAMDTSVIEGHVEKVGPDSFRMTDTGKAHVEQMLGRRP